MRLQFKTIQVFLAFILASTALSLALITGIFFYWLQYEQSQASNKQAIRTLMSTVMTSASVAAFSGNRPIAKDVVDGLMKNPVVGRVELTGGDAMTMRANRDNVALGAPISINVYSPFDDQEIVGKLTIEPNANQIRAEARHSAFQLVGWLTSIVLLTAVISTFVIQRMITRPIVRVASQIKSIQPGNTVRLTLADHLEKNELGVMVNGFNQLLDTMTGAIHEERQLRERLEKMETRMHQIFDTSTAGIAVIDSTGCVAEANPAFLRLVGFNNEIIKDANIKGFDLAHSLFVEAEQVLSMIATTKPGETCGGDFQVVPSLNSTISWLHLDAFVEGAGSDINRIQCVVYDISERKFAEEVAQHQAMHDHLTGLPNRRNAELKIDHLLRQSKHKNERAALIMIDLDGFKQVNDTKGHEAGDLVLIEAAKRLSDSIRTHDIVSRLGGDEFLVVVANAKTYDGVCRVAQKLIDALCMPIDLPGHGACQIGGSLGIALFPDHGSDREILTVTADMAMYETKRSGKNGYTISGQDYVRSNSAENSS